eukprot:scaffold2364_cov426-Prasinococcus_capsulatus_cf.AAC.11
MVGPWCRRAAPRMTPKSIVPLRSQALIGSADQSPTGRPSANSTDGAASVRKGRSWRTHVVGARSALRRTGCSTVQRGGTASHYHLTTYFRLSHQHCDGVLFRIGAQQRPYLHLLPVLKRLRRACAARPTSPPGEAWEALAWHRVPIVLQDVGRAFQEGRRMVRARSEVEEGVGWNTGRCISIGVRDRHRTEWIEPRCERRLRLPQWHRDLLRGALASLARDEWTRPRAGPMRPGRC